MIDTKVSKTIEFTRLDPYLRSKQIKRIIDLADLRKYRSIVLPYNKVGLARDYIDKKKYDLKIVTVWGFPFDKYNMNVIRAYKNWYDELDMLIPIKDFYQENPPKLDTIEKILNFVREALPNKKLKLIIETLMMENKEKQTELACNLAKKCKIDVIKTNTGLIKRETFGSLIRDIKLIKKYWKGEIKAAGGIRKLDEVKELLKIGVNYIGTSSDIFMKL